MRVVARHPEGVGEIGPLHFVPQRQLDDLLIASVETGDRGLYEVSQLRLFGYIADVGGKVDHVRRFVEGRGDAPGPQPAVTFISRHRVQPWPEPLGVAEFGEFGRGDDVGVLDGIGSVGRLAQNGSAVAEQPCGVFVVCLGKPGWFPRHDGRDNLTVAHGPTVNGLRHSGQARRSNDVH
jgi:hypothetical protein